MCCEFQRTAGVDLPQTEVTPPAAAAQTLTEGRFGSLPFFLLSSSRSFLQLPRSFSSLFTPIRCHPTVPLGSPHECLQAPAAPLHLTPGHPPFLHLQPFLVRLLALGNASLHLAAPSLPGQDLYAGALCHQRVPRAHPPHPTDLRLLPPFPRLPMHTSTSEGEEDPEGGDFQRGDGWRVQGWGEEREQRRGQGGGARLG